ncbi:MAG TPA: O-acetyl-ADP-ribose deacetylase [Acidimicrobiales bacterium]|nr:O-acetyl-ADP-ribose deacetylase [Acidimicrobiales bacterium]
MPPALSAVQADITSLRVDAVVNAANSRLAGGGGVDGAIHRAAGRADLMSACAALGGCEPGDAKATPGFRLPARWIIHTVGPVWQGGRHGEPDVLARCYVTSMQVADQLGARSVAFPAISTGIYGFPKDLAAMIAVNTLRRSASAAQQVILVAYDEETLRMYESHLTGDR